MIRGIGAALREVIGLFVEDGSLAASILLWLLLCGLIGRLGLLPLTAIGLVLAAGVVLLLVENVWRGSGRY